MPAGGAEFRPVNLPEPVRVEEDSRGFPVALRGRRRQSIASISDRWRIDDEWWRPSAEAVSRMYFSVLLASGQRLVIFKDLARGGWYRQGY